MDLGDFNQSAPVKSSNRINYCLNTDVSNAKQGLCLGKEAWAKLSTGATTATVPRLC
jgi:hypothetical protein